MREIAILAAVAFLALAAIGLGLGLFALKFRLKEPPAEATAAAPAPAAPGSAPAAGGRPAWVSGASTVETAYVPEGFPMGLATGQADAAALEEEPTPAHRVLPEGGGEVRRFGTLAVAGLEFPFVLDADPPRLFVDSNRDGDLTNDAGPIAAEGDRFFAAHAEVETPEPYRLWFFTRNTGGVTYYAKCHRAGRFPFVRDVPMILFDSDPDGRYDDEALVLDLDEDGTAGEGESVRAGGEFWVGDRRFRLGSIDPAGRSVTIEY